MSVKRDHRVSYRDR